METDDVKNNKLLNGRSISRLIDGLSTGNISSDDLSQLEATYEFARKALPQAKKAGIHNSADHLVRKLHLDNEDYDFLNRGLEKQSSATIKALFTALSEGGSVEFKGISKLNPTASPSTPTANSAATEAAKDANYQN